MAACRPADPLCAQTPAVIANMFVSDRHVSCGTCAPNKNKRQPHLKLLALLAHQGVRNGELLAPIPQLACKVQSSCQCQRR